MIVNKIINSLIYIIIVNWNHKDDLVETIESFLVQDYEFFKILIVDNASTDDSVKFIRDNYPFIEIIENDNNSGWAEGNNIGIKYALEKGAGFVLLANNDIYIDDKSLLSKMIIDFRKFDINQEKIGILGTTETSYYDKTFIRSQGWIMYPKYEKFSLRFNKFRFINNPLSSKYKIVDFVSGFFMIIKSDVFKDVGLFDENYFMYAEETDFSIRAWAYGYISLVNKDLNVFHKGATSSGENSPFKFYYQIRNNYYLINKNWTNINYPVFYKLIYFFDFIILFIILVFNRLPTKFSRFQILKFAFQGIVDGILNKMQKRI